jgi:hypothetical protein
MRYQQAAVEGEKGDGKFLFLLRSRTYHFCGLSLDISLDINYCGFANDSPISRFANMSMRGMGIKLF